MDICWSFLCKLAGKGLYITCGLWVVETRFGSLAWLANVNGQLMVPWEKGAD